MSKSQKVILISLLLLPILCLNLYAEEKIRTIEEMANALVEGLVSNLSESPLNVKIGKLTLKNTNFSSEFADMFLRQVEWELKRHKTNFKKISRVKISTRDLGLDRIQPGTNIKIKEVTLEGSYWESKGLVIISANLIDENGSIVSASEIKIKKSALNWDLAPQNLAKIQEIEKEIGHLPSKGDFKIDLWIDKGNGGIYRSGEDISVMVRAEIDCYLKVLYIDATGNRILMFPTENDSTNRIRKGVLYALDKENKYTVVPPFGSEVIMAFASTVPFSDAGEINVGGGFRGFSSNKKTSEIVKSLRGIYTAGEQIDIKRAESRAYLTTVRKR